MLNIQLISAWRLLNKYKQHNILTILGLSLGLASALLVFLYTAYETSFDRHHPQPQTTYRIAQQWPSLGLDAPVSSSALNSELRNQTGILDVFNLIHLTPVINSQIKLNDEVMVLNDFYAASANLNRFFKVDLLSGDMEKVLTLPDQIAISTTQAIRLFGHTDIIGKTIQNDSQSWTIAAVFNTLPDNTHLKFDYLTSIDTKLLGEPNPLGNDSFTYLNVSPHITITSLEKDLTDLFNRVIYRNESMVKVQLQRLDKIHLTAQSRFEMKANGSQLVVNICIALTVLLVAIAAINFINMSTAQAMLRAKEVGVKKAMGASKLSLITQFLTESVFISSISAVLALIITYCALPWFNNLLDKQLVLTFSTLNTLFFISITFFIGIIAGLYPALFLTAFDPKKVLSGDLTRGKTAVLVRKSLMVFQTAFSILLIIGAFTLHQQLQYVSNLPTGYEKSQRIELAGVDRNLLFGDKSGAMVNAFKALPFVESASFSDTSLTQSTNTSGRLLWPKAGKDSPIIPFIGTGFDIVTTQGLNLLHGRDFSTQYLSDWHSTDAQGNQHAAIIITKSIAKMAGVDDLASLIGQEWTFTTGEESDLFIQTKIVGIVDDIIIGSANQSSSPTFFICGYSWMANANLVLKLNQPLTPSTLNTIEDLSKRRFNQANLNTQEQSVAYASLYRSERKVADLVVIFTLLVITLTCFGVFGLCSFAANRRRKEIAIRKVLGASILQLVNAIAKEFMLLVMISTLIALPLAYILSQMWLGKFTFHIDQSFITYAITSLLVTAIVWLTVASIAFKAARLHPAEHLKSE